MSSPAESISVEEARSRILSEIRPLETESVPLWQCRGRVLARPVASTGAHPPFDNSAMDGYAVRAADVGPGCRLQVLGTVEAGSVPTGTVGQGQAFKIMTGAPMPAGADSVVMVEDTAVDGQDVRIAVSADSGQHVRRRGEHLSPGQAAVPAGRRLGASDVAMLAYLGLAAVECHRQPRVAILSSGDELVEPGQPLEEGQIYNSNAYALEAQVAQVGGLPRRLPRVNDDPERLKEVLSEALNGGVDAVITSAGVSMGDRDFTLQVMRSLGVEVIFWRVNMRPGRPLGYGRRGSQPFFALPGNPVSSMVTFELFCRPALEKLQGMPLLPPTTVRARLEEPIRKKAGMALFYRCLLRQDGEGWTVRSTGPQDSHLLLSLVQADGLMELPAEADWLDAGTPVTVRLWN